MVDLVGKKFERLTVVKFSHLDKRNARYWCVRCDCGEERKVRDGHMKSGATKSCGCLGRENLDIARHKGKHGMHNSPTYHTWESMKARCLNPNASNYYLYGERGVTICKQWLKFENFFADMKEKPEGKTLDRKNTNGNYEPSNCRWATHKEQIRNRRCTKKITYEGNTKPIAEWAEITGIDYKILLSRFNGGLTAKETIETPVQGRRRK